MQIILRMTTTCNFKCTMCSASQLSEATELSFDKIIEVLEKYKHIPNNVCFEGGDPLCVKPQIYYDIFDYVDSHKDINITEFGFTSNLWDFYKHPDKWIDIFKRDDVHICTSFQYGDKRRITDKRVFDEQTFIDVYNKFIKLVNKPLPFITVIDQSNEHTVLQTCKLAKSLDTVCKINPTFVAGRARQFYRWDRMLQQYQKIFEAGLEHYESNCLDIARKIVNQPYDINCPFIRDCSDKFVVVTPDGWCSSCSIENSTKNDQFYPIKFYDRNNVSNITLDKSKSFIDSKCLTCDYFDWCNSCRVKVGELKSLHLDQSQFDQYCNNIKNSIDAITNIVNERYAKDRYYIN